MSKHVSLWGTSSHSNHNPKSRSISKPELHSPTVGSEYHQVRSPLPSPCSRPRQKSGTRIQAPLCSLLPQGLQEYEEWKWGKNPTMVEVLEEFPSIQMPATLLLTQLSLLQPRYYSISSSPDMYPDEVHLTVAIVSYHTRGAHAGKCQLGDPCVCVSPSRCLEVSLPELPVEQIPNSYRTLPARVRGMECVPIAELPLSMVRSREGVCLGVAPKTGFPPPCPPCRAALTRGITKAWLVLNNTSLTVMFFPCDQATEMFSA